MSDLSFAQLIEIVQHVVRKRGVDVVFIDRWEPTSQTCSGCGHRQAMPLRDRTFEYGACGVATTVTTMPLATVSPPGIGGWFRGGKTRFNGQPCLTTESQVF